ncbi:MAG: aspartate kinase [Spirochaetes bacterium]|nr:aspartate kinase [Spirochaetota bacterium]
MIVMKFGGSSIGTAEKIERCINIIADQKSKNPAVIVSAHGKTTNGLISMAESALEGNNETNSFIDFHNQLIADLKLDKQLLTTLYLELNEIIHGVKLVKELTYRTMDYICSFGERASSAIIAAALSARGYPAVQVNSYDIGLLTDNHHGSAHPLSDIDEGIAKNILSLTGIPVITGFLGRSNEGKITTLGRSGSDFSASIIGAALNVEEIQIWTDVDGVMTADPSVCSEAANLPVMSFQEASELAFYGAEVLHPATLMPAVQKKIPIKVLNSAKPQEKGTLILTTSQLSDRIAKSIVYKENLSLINIVAPQFRSTAQLLNTALTKLIELHKDIHIAATSESSISFVLDKPYTDEQLEQIVQECSALGTVSIKKNKCLVCVVGEELKGNPNVLGLIFNKLKEMQIKATMVSQSASEINVAFLIENDEIKRTVSALHSLLTELSTRKGSVHS